MEDHVTKFALLLTAFWTATHAAVLACLRGDFHLVDLSATIVLKVGPPALSAFNSFKTCS